MSLRKEKKKRTKNAIIQVAITLFNENGYENTSIEKIAKLAGIGKGTVYGYFETKMDIIKAFFEQEFDKIHRELVNNTDENAPVLEQMLTIYITDFNLIAQNKVLGRLFMRTVVFPDKSEAPDNFKMENKYIELLIPIIGKAQQRREFREGIELLHIHAHFYGVYLFIVSAWYSGRIPDHEVSPVMRLLFSQRFEGFI